MSGLREALALKLNRAGAYCGECSYEEGFECAACEECCLRYADAIFPLLASPEHRDEVRALIGDEQVGVPQRWVDEVVLALDAATTIGQRSCRTGDHLHYANHDRLLREAGEHGYSVYAPREEPTPERCPAGICRRPAGHEGPHRECPFYVGQREEP